MGTPKGNTGDMNQMIDAKKKTHLCRDFESRNAVEAGLSN